MFRFVLQVAFIRRVLQFSVIRIVIAMVLAGALIAGLIYAFVIFQALTERNQAPHVQRHSTH